MVYMTPGDYPPLPVERLAQLLLRCAEDDPTLSARPDTGVLAALSASSRVPPAIRLDPLSLKLSMEHRGDDRELEQLVSIAIACARRAEDACGQAHELSRLTRRRMSLVAGVVMAGALAGTAALVADRHSANADSRLAEVVSGIRDVSTVQKQTTARLEEIGSDMATRRDSAVVTEPVLPVATPEKAGNPAPTRAVTNAGLSPYPAPVAMRTPQNKYVPASHPYHPTVRRAAGPPRPQLALAQVVANVRRNLRVLFQ